MRKVCLSIGGHPRNEGTFPEGERKMKKLFALMLALCLMLGGAAMAENAITWEEVSPALEAAGVQIELKQTMLVAH